jgi:hypothetical protein
MHGGRLERGNDICLKLKSCFLAAVEEKSKKSCPTYGGNAYKSCGKRNVVSVKIAIGSDYALKIGIHASKAGPLITGRDR